MGDLDDECGDIRANRPLEGDAQVEGALDLYLQDMKELRADESPAAGTKRTGGSSYSALIGRTMIRANDLLGDDDGRYAAPVDPPPIAEVLADADRALADTPEMEPSSEDVLIDGRSYLSLSRWDPWGCESVLTTYSNLDNTPAVMGRSSFGGKGIGRRRRGGGRRSRRG